MEEKYQREYELIQKTGKYPITSATINRTLVELGVRRATSIMLHVSMRSIGWHVGGSVVILKTIMDRIGEDGLLVMPSHSNDISDPDSWENPPIPESWKTIVRDNMPIYNPDWTPALRVGITAELFRNLPGVYRSAHPQLSLAAWGKDAAELTSSHPLDFPNGEESPLAKLYDRNALIILYGVDFTNCTMLHLAEYRADWPGKHVSILSVPRNREKGKTEWSEFQEIEFAGDDFKEIGSAFHRENPHLIHCSELGFGKVYAVHAVPLVDFALRWIEENRREPLDT